MSSLPDPNDTPTDVGSEQGTLTMGVTRRLTQGEHIAQEHGVPAEPDGFTLQAGEPMGRYLVLGDLARGGMSIVYVAYDPKLDRRVALKVMRPDTNEDAAKSQARLLREAQAMARLAHPNVVRVYDVGVIGERVYMAMELVEGETLRDWMTARPRRWREIVDVLVRAGRGLAAAHDAGLVHLDVKPRNVLVGVDGEVRVADFGLARAPRAGPDVASCSGSQLRPLDDAVTHVGMVMGTPGYMAPEQLEGADPDAHADQFAFCVTAWEALYGQRPFAGRRLDEYREGLAGGTREPPRGRRVPVRLRRILERGLSLEPSCRYPQLDDLLDAMMVDRRRQWLRIGGLVGVLGAAGLVTWAIGRPPEDPCARQSERLEPVWGEARRARIESRLIQLDAARHRPESAELMGRLDTYAASWSTVATESCRTAQLEGRGADTTLDARSYCLEHRLGSLAVATELLLEVEPSADEEWSQVVAGLPTVAACHDVTSLYDIGRPPADARLRQTMAEIDTRISRTWALIYLGRPSQALEEADAAVREADSADHGPAQARARSARTQALGMLGHWEQAERSGFETLWMADVEGLHTVRIEALIDLVFYVGVQGGRLKEAERLGHYGLRLEEHLTPNPDLRAQLLSNLGALDVNAGRLERARTRFSEAIELRQDYGEEGSIFNVTTTWMGLGTVEHQLGDYEAALETFGTVRQRLTDRYGPMHLATFNAWENEATALHALERYEEALEILEEIRDRSEQLGDDAGSRYGLFAALGAVYLDLHRYSEAESALERARGILEGQQVRSLSLAATLGNLAVASLEQGKLEVARQHAQRGLALMNELVGAQHVYRAWMLGLLARAELRRGDALVALEHAAQSRAVLSAADEVKDELVKPEFRAEASLGVAQALADPRVQATPGLVDRWGGGRSARAWAEQARDEALAGGRGAQAVLQRAQRWLQSQKPG